MKTGDLEKAKKMMILPEKFLAGGFKHRRLRKSLLKDTADFSEQLLIE